MQPHFYNEVAKIIEQGYDAFVINRRTIPDKYKNISEIPLMLEEEGKPHGGHDCFIFKRSLYPKFVLDSHCIGIPASFVVVLLNCVSHAEKFQEFKDLHLTFHIGNDKIWKREEYADYRLHNHNQMQTLFDGYQQQGILPNIPLVSRFFKKYMKSEKSKNKDKKNVGQSTVANPFNILASKTSSLLAESPTNDSWKDYYQLAEEFAREKELSSAISAYQKVIEINPNHSWSYQKLGNIFREQNKDDRAVTAYRQAIEINPNFSWSHYHLATVLEKQGKFEEAKASYQKAIELYPNFSAFRYKLENLLKLKQV